MKLLLYCTKAKPRLVYRQIPRTLMGLDNSFEGFMCGTLKEVGINEHGECELLNGKIVAECDFEVEKIYESYYTMGLWSFQNHYVLETNTLKKGLLYDKAQSSGSRMYEYLKTKKGYAIHIKNLHIFDEPKELREYYNKKVENITKAPQNMMLCHNVSEEIKTLFGKTTRTLKVNEYVLISIQPQWLCKILNGEKTVEVRKKVLKEMLI